jgi:hypothetical protein
MTPISDRTETESIERVFSVLLEVDVERRESFSRLEWAGIGALLHDFYNGIENALERVVPERVKALAESPDRQRDLVAAAASVGLISKPCANRLKPYLAFDHYCVLGHSLELDPKSVVPLVREAKATFEVLRGEIGATLPVRGAAPADLRPRAGSAPASTRPPASPAPGPQAQAMPAGPPASPAPEPQAQALRAGRAQLPAVRSATAPSRVQHLDRRVARDLAAGYGEPAVPALQPTGTASPESLFPSHW